MLVLSRIWSEIDRAGLVPSVCALAAWLLASIVVGLTRRSSRGTVRSAAKRVLREVSVTTHEDEPGTFTVPKLLKRLFAAIVRNDQPESAQPKKPRDPARATNDRAPRGRGGAPTEVGE